MTMYRVQKLLSNYGYCSRRKAEEFIAAGKVSVNGKIISLGDKASAQDVITIDGKTIKQEKNIYLVMNKPTGCVTALVDKHHKTVMDYVKIRQRVFPIGRLDYNTSGLLLLTNDGDFANQIMHPRYEIKKTYLVETNKPLSKSALLRITRGLHLEDGKTAPAQVRLLEDTLIELTIHEGKNRIIRRMMKKLGYSLLRLERIKIGKLSLGNLKPGSYRKLTKKEKDLLV